MEPWNPYLADVRLGVDANLPKLSLKALKCLNERLKTLPHFNVVIVLSFTGFSVQLKPFRSCKRNEFVNKSWYRSRRCLGIYGLPMEFWVDLVKAAWDCGIFERTLLK